MKTVFSHLDRFLGIGLLLGALMFPAAEAAAQKPPRTIPLTIGKHQIRVEVVQTDEERTKGRHVTPRRHDTCDMDGRDSRRDRRPFRAPIVPL